MNINLPDPDAPLCPSGKRPHRDEDAALRAMRTARAARIRQHNGSKPGDIEEGVHECPICRWFHVTSSSRPRRRRELAARGRRMPKRR